MDDRKLQIDYIDGFSRIHNSWELLSSHSKRTQGKEIQRLKEVLKTEILKSKRISSIIFTLRYQNELTDSENNYAKVMETCGIVLSNKTVWDHLLKDLDGDGKHDSLEIIQAVFGNLELSRINLIRKAWLSMDSGRKGAVECSLVERSSNLKMVDNELLKDLIDCIGNGKLASYDAFFHFYFSISKMIESDSDFQVLMKAI